MVEHVLPAAGARVSTTAPATTFEVLQAAASAWPDALAIEDGEVALTFSDLRDRVLATAGDLVRRGIGPGDRVAIWAPNGWAWIVAALAVHRLGAALVPINTRYRGAEARYLIDAGRCRLLFTVRGLLGVDLAALLDRPDLPTIHLDDGLAAGPPAQLPPPPTPEVFSDILFTSGTTGHPKGVPTTHAQSVRAFTAWCEVVGLQHGDRYLVVAPFFHCFGYKAGWLACLIRGATVLPQAVFDVDAVLQRIPRDRVSVLPGPPALYQSLLQRDLSQHDLRSLRLAVTGAASIPVRLIERMRDELGFQTVITGYGLTEACGVSTMCRAGDPPERIANTSGRAIPGVEVRVVDPDGRPLPPHTPGEVVVRGYTVMSGYLDAPEQTAETLRDGWLHTGDIGVLDELGYLRITDRLKDMFIVGGFNAYPAEIEHLLLDHPGLREVAVVGVPDERLGEVGVAFVVADHPIDPDALTAWCRERMANFKVPRTFRQVDALPRNASAKVLKHVLRAAAVA
jgi:acyl-CoA synthetase (AMP-forming)/AMP-acid ligase II